MARFVLLALVAAAQAQNPKISVSDGDLTIDLPLDATAKIVRETTVDIDALRDRLDELENTDFLGAAANTAATATTSTFGNVLAATDQQINLLEAGLSSTTANIQNIISNTVAAGMRDVNNMMDSKLSHLDSAIAANQSALAAQIDDDVMELTHRANASTPKGLVIGYKECATTRANGADSTNYVFMTCTYTKKRSDTILYLQLNSNGRQIRSSTYWRFYVDGQPCQGPANQGQGDIRTAWHGSGYDLHRPQTIGGSCFRRGGQNLPSGNRAIKWQQWRHNGDSYIGWRSSSRIRVLEFMPDTDMWQID